MLVVLGSDLVMGEVEGRGGVGGLGDSFLSGVYQLERAWFWNLGRDYPVFRPWLPWGIS